MKKPLKERPDAIRVHERDSALASRIIETHQELQDLKAEMVRVKNRIALNDAKRRVLWDEIEKEFAEDISIIAPERQLEWTIQEEQVFVTKSSQKPPHPLQELLERLAEHGAEMKFGEFEVKKKRPTDDDE